MDLPFPLKPRPPGARKKSAMARSQLPFPGPVTNGFITSFDGTKLFYSTEGTGKPLIFCYGLICSSLHWTYQIEHFRRHYKAIWVDYRGHQNSEVPKNLNSLTVSNIARDLGTVLDELKVEDAVFLGHSMGVNVVLEFYRQQPHRVSGLVLANGTPQRPLETLFRTNSLQSAFNILRKAYERNPKLVTMLWRLQKGNPISRMLLTLGGFNPYLTAKEDIQMYGDQVAEMDPGIMVYLIQNYDHYDATAWLHTIIAPTLILAGDQDKITPLEQQELMHQLIPGSQLDVIKHGSHCPQMDLPDLVNIKIEKFLESINYCSASTPTTESANQSTAPRPGPLTSSSA